jgi:hypothetical protein
VRQAAWPVLDDPRAVRTLATLPAEDYAPLVIDALRRRGSRVEAMRGLAEMRHAAAVPHVIPLLDSQDREEAHRALILITGALLGPRRSEWTHWWANHRG